MILTWIGHSCFRLEGKDVSLLIDPFSKEIGLKPPRIKDNLVLLTHRHYDHASIDDVDSETMVIDGPGEYESHGVYVHGISSFHDNSGGTERGLNTIYVIKLEEVTICHLGDLGQEKLDEQQLELIGNIDVLLIPVGGKYTIDYKQAVAVVGQIEPKVIVPMHHKLPDLKIEGLDGVEKFLKEMGLTPEKLDKLKVTPKTLPQEEIKLVTLSL
ncbi:MAG: MBL fold metallo-hydrolase [bacterium]|nr:MBL fold metallo-hydrolase [bacterium]